MLPRYPDADSGVNGPPVRLGQKRALDLLRATAPDRVLAVDLETEAGVPVYVHAKVCIVDDVWFTCGSDNFNLRSWTTDSEITCAVVDRTLDHREPADLSGAGDGARVLARELRLQLWAEHLGLDPADPRLVDPEQAWELWVASAAGARRLARGRPEGPASDGAGPLPRARAADPGTGALGTAALPGARRPRRPAPAAAAHRVLLSTGRAQCRPSVSSSSGSGSPAARANASKPARIRARSRGEAEARIRSTSAARRSVTSSTRARPASVRSTTTSRRLSALVSRRTHPWATSRSAVRVNVDWWMPSRSASTPLRRDPGSQDDQHAELHQRHLLEHLGERTRDDTDEGP